MTSCDEAIEMTEAIIEALQEANTTLRFVGIRGQARSNIPTDLYLKLCYYLHLNVAGRATMRSAQRANISNVVEALVTLSEQELGEEKASVTFYHEATGPINPRQDPMSSPWNPSTPTTSPSSAPLSPPWRPPSPLPNSAGPVAVTPSSGTPTTCSSVRHFASGSPDQLAIVYGLLRDCPHIWSMEYHENSDEDVVSRDLGDSFLADL
jgi:hypothetical protein